MTLTTILAYGLIGCYFVIERLLRKGKHALSLQAGQSDRGSSSILLTSGVLGIILVLMAPLLNASYIGLCILYFFAGVELCLW